MRCFRIALISGSSSQLLSLRTSPARSQRPALAVSGEVPALPVPSGSATRLRWPKPCRGKPAEGRQFPASGPGIASAAPSASRSANNAPTRPRDGLCEMSLRASPAASQKPATAVCGRGEAIPYLLSGDRFGLLGRLPAAAAGPCNGVIAYSPSYRSCHSGFIALTSSHFFCLEPPLICFSRAMASRTSPYTS